PRPGDRPADRGRRRRPRGGRRARGCLPTLLAPGTRGEQGASVRTPARRARPARRGPGGHHREVVRNRRGRRGDDRVPGTQTALLGGGCGVAWDVILVT